MSTVWIFIVIAIALVWILSVLFRNQSTIFLIEIVRDRIFYVLVVAFLIFVFFSMYSIYSTYDVSLTSVDGAKQAGKLLWLWTKGLFGNIARVGGYTVSQDWILSNSTA